MNPYPPVVGIVAGAARTAAVLLAVLGLASPARPAAPDEAEMAHWLAQMKASPRGPFDAIRWFCKDGTVLPPGPYACVPHGGGRQHGRLGQHATTLRQAGYLVGNVLAATDAAALADEPDLRALKAILLERYLVAEDDGWILRRARYYRGALQVEDEIAAANAILAALAARPQEERDFLLLRQAAMLLPQARDGATVAQVHELSSSLATLDPGFVGLRNKIHGHPDASDAGRVRDYARRQKRTEPEFEALAGAIVALFAPRDLDKPLRAFARRLGDTPLADELLRLAPPPTAAPAHRFAAAAALLARLREAQPALPPVLRPTALRLSLAAEAEVFAAGRQLSAGSRADRLARLGDAAAALYGVGLLTAREYRAVRDTLARLDTPRLPLGYYRAELGYLARVPAWTGRELAFHFAGVAARLARIEPLAGRFVVDRQRASPLLLYTTLLDGLLLEANELAGLDHDLFGKTAGSGLRALNPGLARGILHLDATEPGVGGIHLLPETMERLPPVAGILTLEAGNMLSHVQLLAGNLGIPNVVVDTALVPELEARAGRAVVLAVSPGGRVLLAEDGPRWNDVFGQTGAAPARLSPDLAKLDLGRRAPLPLGELRAADAGRIAGPKAARLGELKRHYPEQVADGVVIPFGAYLAFLERPMPGTGMSAHAWMRAEYRRLAALPDGQRAGEARRLRERLRDWIMTTDPGADFRTELAQAMQARFGADGAVFVRSDTNVEDLPGFSGAGLNLTVPNVVGLDAVVAAIQRVWASPFEERAFAWRQLRMDAPEHVYVSVLLQRAVAVDKSGVMVTMDLDGGGPGAFTVAVNEGAGGAVAGQAAEELLIGAATGDVRLLAEASAANRRVIAPGGGLVEQVASGRPVLATAEIEQLRRLGLELPLRFPQHDESGDIAPADVEFGFVAGRLALFQIRPFLQSKAARRHHFLLEMDAPLFLHGWQPIDLREVK